MRRSSRVRWKMPLKVTSLDAKVPFSEMCETLIVNMHGCGLRSPAPLAIANPVQIETADHRKTTGWVTDFQPMGSDGKWWLLGLALEQEGNFWGIPNPPEDWSASLAANSTAGGESRKLDIWPSAIARRETEPKPVMIQSKPPRPTAVPSSPSRPTAAATAPAPAHEKSEQLLTWLQAEMEKRVAADWGRFRQEAEQQLQTAARDLEQRLHRSFDGWEKERTAAESKLQKLLELRDQLQLRLDSIGEMLREQSAPVREEMIAQVRAQVQALIVSFQERVQSEAQAREAAQAAVAAQLSEAEKARREAEVLLQSLPKTIDSQVLARAEAALEAVRAHAAGQISGQVSDILDRLGQQLQQNLERAGGDLEKRILGQAELREQAFATVVSGRMEELRAADEALRISVRELTENLTLQSEQVLAQMRVQTQEFVESHGEQLIERLRRQVQAAPPEHEKEQASSAAREALASEIMAHRDEIASSQQALRAELESLERRSRELESRLDEVRQAREYVDSLSKTLDQSVEGRIREGVAAAIAQMQGAAFEEFTLRAQNEILAMERRLRQVGEELDAALLQRSTGHDDRLAREWSQSQEMMASLKSGLEQMISERRHELQQFLVRAQSEAEAKLQKEASSAVTVLQQQLDEGFHQRQERFEKARAAAVAELEKLEKRAGELTAVVDVELQKHAEDLVAETVTETAAELQAAAEQVRREQAAKAEAEVMALTEARLRERSEALVRETVNSAGDQLRQSASQIRERELAGMQAELDRVLGTVVQQAASAGSDLRTAVQSLQQELQKTQAAAGESRRQAEEAHSWLARETEQFQKTLHDGFLQATGEIRGRIHQAVEMAEEPIDRRVREIHAQLEAQAQRTSQQLDAELEQTRDRLLQSLRLSQDGAESALQARVTQALESFRIDAERLSRSSMERWQAAISATLQAIPQVLDGKLRESE